MSLLSRARLALAPGPTPGQRVNAVVEQSRALAMPSMSRPVAYTGGYGGAGRVPVDLERAVEHGFAGSSLAYRCVQSIVTNCASLDLLVEQQGADGGLEPQPQHPVSVLWNRQPNPVVSARAFKEVVWSHLELAGEAFVYLDRGPEGIGDVQALYPIFDPVEVVVSRDTGGTLLGYRVNVGGRTVPLLPDEVLWLRYPHPRQAWGAMAPFRAAQFALDLDGWAKAWQLGEMKNGARPEGVLFLGDVDRDVHDAVVQDFADRHQGPRNANRHLFLSGQVPAKYERIGLTPQEVSYAETRQQNAEEVFLAFGVPRDYLLGGTTYENRRAARQTLWTDTIVPKLELVAGEVDRQLLPDLSLTCRFDTSGVDALRENEDAVTNRASRVTYSDIATMNEARLMVGLDRIEDALYDLTLTEYREAVRHRQAAAAGLTTPLLPAAPTSGARQARTDAAVALPGPSTRAVAVDVQAVEREYARVERIGVMAVQRLADKMEAALLARLERKQAQPLRQAVEEWDAAYEPSPDLTAEQRLADLAGEVRQGLDGIFDVGYWQEQARLGLGDTLVAAAFDAGAAMTAKGLGIGFDTFDQEVIRQVHRRSQVLAEQVVETTRQALEQHVLDAGLEAGESIPDLAARIRDVTGDLRGWRSEAIARTETVGGYNASSRIAATASGLVTQREWNATLDDRTRESHQALHGYRTQGLDDRYPNGLLHPGDPMGETAEVVNCRCVETFVLAPPGPGE